MRTRILLLSFATLLPAALLSAQNPTPRQAPAPADAAPHAATATASTAGDAILATWLHSACTNEIALARIAVKQADTNDVRAFAQRLIDDHTAFATRLRPFTEALPTPGKTAGGVKPATDGKRPIEASGDRPRTAVDTFDHAGLIRDLAARCLASETTMLTSKPADEFDRSFLAMQVAAHQRGLDMLAVFRTFASPTLVAAIDEGTKVYGSHHEQLLALQKKAATAGEGSEGR